MKKVLLSHDGKMKMYLVPGEVADYLKISPKGNGGNFELWPVWDSVRL